MFLKSIELFGFKSFADRSKLEFSDGISALLGPNGCGKSNIVDSIKWVLGEQSTKTLRAGKMEDVIFNGTESRKALQVSEVALVISNEEGYLPMDVAEVELKRRVHRSGESEYLINNTPVKLRDIRELFFDTGIGKSAYSILEQGKIDQILSHRPEDRRYIFEEAAGISRYKQKSAEAERKLAQTDENLKQVENILKEVKKSYDSLKKQAEKAEEYQKLQTEIFNLEVIMQLSRLREIVSKRDANAEQVKEDKEAEIELRDEINRLNLDLEENLDKVNALSQEKITIQTKLQRIDESKNSIENQLGLLMERVKDFKADAKEAQSRGKTIQERIVRDKTEIDRYRKQILEFEDSIEEAEDEIESFTNSVRAAEERIERNDGEIKELESKNEQIEKEQQDLQMDLQNLTDDIVEQLDEQLKETGYSAKYRKELEEKVYSKIERILTHVHNKNEYTEDVRKAQRFSDEDTSVRIFEEFKTICKDVQEGVNSIAELFEQYTGAVPSFIDEFLSPEGIITRKREIDSRIKKNRDAIRNNRSAILTHREENEHLRTKLQSYRKTLENLRISLADSGNRKDQLGHAVKDLQKRLSEQELLYEDTSKDVEIAKNREQETKRKIEKVNEENEKLFEEEQQLKTNLEKINTAIHENSRNVESRKKQVDAYTERTGKLKQRIERAEIEIESLNREISAIYEQFEETYARSLKEFETNASDQHEDKNTIRNSMRDKREQLRNLGSINHMAAQEFEEVKERYDFLSKQIRDLTIAEENLIKITTEITQKSEELFTVCYNQIKTNFHNMFRKLFGGGRAEIRLMDPENVLESGIDILAQPPGKKLERISLLSGGERSLTAVALLFATYMVKPSPFCVLDEIDAALDDANVGRFLNVLEDFSRESQFIIITHNKKTVIGASALLGVTMEEPGVSKIISYRLSDSPGNDFEPRLK
ncbi:MAG: AAA family ATPase [Spirochaetia bacterium]|nr:AAA family ATPase [Spirochaetia bacterium]